MATKLENFQDGDIALRPGFLRSGVRQLGGKPNAALPLPRLADDVRGASDLPHAADDRLGPARGLLLGLACGAVLWAGLIALAWWMLG